MKQLLWPFPALAAAASPAFAQEAERPRDPQNYEPWLAEQQVRPGDKWARVQLDLDARGRPLRCRIVASNIRRGQNNMRFYVCNAFMGGGFETAPVMRDGVAVPGTIERFIVIPGRNSRDEYQRARREHRARQRGERD